MDATVFYVLGIALVIVALVVSFLGLRSERFPSTPLMAVCLFIFIGLVGATTTFAVLNAKEEQKTRREKLAEEEKKFGSAPAPGGGTVPKNDLADLTGQEIATAPEGGAAGGKPPAKQPKVKGPGGNLSLTASKTQLAFNTTQLSGKPGKVTINLDNPAQIPHTIGVEKGSQLLADSPQITQSKTSISVDLAPGTYEFLCTVPGHAEAGMKGTLTVK